MHVIVVYKKELAPGKINEVLPVKFEFLVQKNKAQKVQYEHGRAKEINMFILCVIFVIRLLLYLVQPGCEVPCTRL